MALSGAIATPFSLLSEKEKAKLPLEAYMAVLADAGLAITTLKEPFGHITPAMEQNAPFPMAESPAFFSIAGIHYCS